MTTLNLTLLGGSVEVTAQSQPTPQDVVASLMGSWVGTLTLYYNGKAITETFSETITPLGTNGLGYQSTVTSRVGKGAPSTGSSWQYDTGEVDGSTSQNGNTTAVLSGTWSIQNNTIYATSTVQTGTTEFTENTQTVVTGQTLNTVATYSFGGARAVGSALKIITPVLTFSPPSYPLAYSPKENFSLSASSPSGGAITYSSSDPKVISILGHTATIKGVGTATLTASQVAKNNYTSATTSADVTVNKSTPVLNMAAIPSQKYAPNKFVVLKATSSAGLTPITFSCSNPAIGVVIGNRLHILGSGTTTLSAFQAGNQYYNSSTATQSLIVR